MAAKRGNFQITARPVTVLGHLVAMAVVALLLVWLLHFREGIAFKSPNKNKILDLHVLLMVAGFIIFGGEAIMAFKAIPAKKYWRKVVHLVLHLIALVAGVIGVYAAFKFHHETHTTHLLSLHSWLGLTTICLYGLQWAFGFFAYFYPGAESRRRASMLPWHIYFGIFIFLIATCTAELGLLQRFNTLTLGHSQEGLIVNFTGLLLLLYAAIVALTVVLQPVY